MKTDEEHLALTDERWITCVEAHHGRQEFIRKSAIVEVLPYYQWSNEERAFVPFDPPRLMVLLENGKESMIFGELHAFFEKHLKSTFMPSPIEGPGAELLD